jgi:hypothetical protein
MDYGALKTEIDTGPLTTELKPGGKYREDGEIAAILNDPRFPTAGDITTGLIVKWAAKQKLLSKLKDHSENKASPIRDAAIAALLAFGSGLTDPTATLDLADSGIADLVNAFVTAGEMTTAQRAELVALATTKKSRVEIVFGPGQRVDHTDVAIALRG